jgi:hypothetical protein
MKPDYNLKVAFKIISHSRKESSEKGTKKGRKKKVMN